MIPTERFEQVEVASAEDLGAWLAARHGQAESVWLVRWLKRAGARSVPIDAILDEPAFAVEHATALRQAVVTYRSRSIDLHDCLLSAIAAQRGTRVLSFDDDLRRLGTAERP